MGTRPVTKVLAVMFGLHGHTEITYTGDSMTGHLSGYENPESWTPHVCSVYGPYDYSDALAFDQRGMFSRNPMLVLSLPMVGNVPDDQPERFREIMSPREQDDNLMCRAMEREPGNMYGTLLTLARHKGFSGLDFVSPNMYAQLVREHGARVGKIVEGKIIWDE